MPDDTRGRYVIWRLLDGIGLETPVIANRMDMCSDRHRSRDIRMAPRSRSPPRRRAPAFASATYLVSSSATTIVTTATPVNSTGRRATGIRQRGKREDARHRVRTSTRLHDASTSTSNSARHQHIPDPPPRPPHRRDHRTDRRLGPLPRPGAGRPTPAVKRHRMSTGYVTDMRSTIPDSS